MGIFDVGLRGFREWKKQIAGLEPILDYKVRLPIVAAATAQDTLLVIPAGAIIYPYPYIEVLTAEATGATKTVDVGVSGNGANSFLDGVSVAATGKIPGAATYTVGSNDTYFASSTLGALLALIKLAGADVVGDNGVYLVEPYFVASPITVDYTLGSDDFAELDAWFHVPVFDFS